MKILCVFGEHNYGDPNRGTGYEYTNFIPSLKRLGHEIVFFESWNKKRYKNYFDLNRHFLKTVLDVQPDVIFCVLMSYEIWIETFERVKRATDALIINWATDDSWKYEQFSRFLAPHVDLYVTTYPEALEKSRRQGLTNVILSQWAANADKLLEPVPANACQWDVSFVGMAYGNRTQWVSALQSHGIRVSCFGHGWENGAIPTESIPEIIRKSVISLNFGDSNWMVRGIRPYRSRQVKARIFEVPGYGGFLMTQNAENLDTFFQPGKELVLFDSLYDLERKIRHFIANPEKRDAIAWAGHRRTHREHTYDKRFGDIFDYLARLKKTQSARPGRRPANRINVLAEFDKLEKIHRPTACQDYFKKALVKPCALVWGPQRGPRAARRILFELSWRTCGKKTYMASGWPGRLFYYES
jgi:spore maturation protein CgeB